MNSIDTVLSTLTANLQSESHVDVASTKLGIHVGIHTVVKRQCWLGGQLRMCSFCRQNGRRPFFVRVVWWVFLPPILIFQAPYTRTRPLGRSGIVKGAMGLCWKFWVVDNLPWWDWTLMDEVNVWAWPTCNYKLRKVDGGRAQYVIESKVQWKPFWLATQQYPENDWLGGILPYTMTYAHGPHWNLQQREGDFSAFERLKFQWCFWWWRKLKRRGGSLCPTDRPKLFSVPPWTWSPCLIWTFLNNHLHCTMSVNLAYFLTRRLNPPFSLLTSFVYIHLFIRPTPALWSAILCIQFEQFY